MNLHAQTPIDKQQNDRIDYIEKVMLDRVNTRLHQIEYDNVLRRNQIIALKADSVIKEKRIKALEISLKNAITDSLDGRYFERGDRGFIIKNYDHILIGGKLTTNELTELKKQIEAIKIKFTKLKIITE